MGDVSRVSNHYATAGLLEAIRAGVEASGKSVDTVTVEDLGPVEEFHIGGRAATTRLLDALGIGAGDHVLDAGCGLGGTSRYAAHHYGSRVTGLDLSESFLEVGREICRWVALTDRVALRQGSVTAMPFDDGVFDKAYTMHVGMNIDDKATFARELFRVLVDGGRVGVYDVMRTGPGDIDFPVPWADAPEASALADPDTYRRALEDAGFVVESMVDRRDFALEFFARMKDTLSGAGGPPPLGLHLVMGETAPVKIDNMVRAIASATIAPVEVLATRSL